MKKNLLMFGAAGLLAAVMMVSGCGSNDDSTVVVPATTTTTTAAATTTTTTSTAATTTTTAVPTTTTTTLAAAVPVSAAGTSDAATADRTYTVAAGSYTYTISGFGIGDKLVFPAVGATVTGQTSWTDGNVTVKYADTASGTVAYVLLTGFTPAVDQTLNSVADFNTVFGSGTITP